MRTLLLLLTLAAAGCASSARPTATDAAPVAAPVAADTLALIGPTWTLVQIGDSAAAVAVTAVFEPDGRITGVIACHSLGGSFEQHGRDKVTLRDVSSSYLDGTLCQDQEAPVLAALEGTARIARAGARLTLQRDGAPRLTFEATRVPQDTLRGTLTYAERLPLSPDALVQVSLNRFDVDAGSYAVARTRFRVDGRQAPIPFTLVYDAGRLRRNQMYTVEALLVQPGETVWHSGFLSVNRGDGRMLPDTLRMGMNVQIQSLAGMAHFTWHLVDVQPVTSATRSVYPNITLRIERDSTFVVETPCGPARGTVRFAPPRPGNATGDPPTDPLALAQTTGFAPDLAFTLDAGAPTTCPTDSAAASLLEMIPRATYAFVSGNRLSFVREIEGMFHQPDQVRLDRGAVCAVGAEVLLGAAWVLVSVDGAEAPEGLTLAFGPDGDAAGEAPCGRFRARYRAGGDGTLSVSDLDAPACDAATRAALAGAARYRTDDDRLTLDGRHTLVLEQDRLRGFAPGASFYRADYTCSGTGEPFEIRLLSPSSPDSVEPPERRDAPAEVTLILPERLAVPGAQLGLHDSPTQHTLARQPARRGAAFESGPVAFRTVGLNRARLVVGGEAFDCVAH